MRMLVAMLIIIGACVVASANEPAESDVRMLANEVDALQLIADMKLTEKQMNSVIAQVAALQKKREELRKREEAILLEIKVPLEKVRDALAEGKEVPASVSAITAPKQKELQQIRGQEWKALQTAISSCAALLDEGQLRVIARTPDVMKRAQEIVQQVRSAQDNTALEPVVSELLEIKKLDKRSEWISAEEAALKLTGEARNNALADLEKQKEAETVKMKAEIAELLNSIREADIRVLSVAVNKVAGALRTKADVQLQVFDMMGRLLDNPAAEKALKERLSAMSSEKLN